MPMTLGLHAIPKNYLRVAISVLLLTIYGSGSLVMDFAHHLVHNHADVAFDAKKTVCYESNRTDDNSHHFNRSLENCTCDHILFQVILLLTISVYISFSAKYTSWNVVSFTSVCTANILQLKLRGPPGTLPLLLRSL